jgi:hypothetical protein
MRLQEIQIPKSPSFPGLKKGRILLDNTDVSSLNSIFHDTIEAIGILFY